jgi:RimJ/RimL family protein N-acetyltransferase
MNLFLREIERNDLPTINSWRADRDLVSNLTANFRYISLEVDQKWFDAYLASRSNNVRLAICDCSQDEILGVVYLLKIDWVNRTSEFGIQIGKKEFYGRGVGDWAMRKMLEHAFGDLNLHRVTLTVLENNDRALRLYKKLGFTEEGRLRQAVFKNGKHLDLIVMAILEDEFYKVMKNQYKDSIEP